MIVCVGYFYRDIFPAGELWSGLLKGNTLLLSLPFFLPVFIGMMQGKMDLYCASYFLSQEQVGKYQVYMNLLTIPHSLAMFTVMPFIKNVYRLPSDSLKKITNKLNVAAFIAPLPALLIIYFIIQNYYHLQFSILMYVLGYIQLITFFLYFFKMQILIRYDKQNIIVWITLATAVLSFLTSMFLIPFWDIQGAIIANAVTQWATLLLFIYSNRLYQK